MPNARCGVPLRKITMKQNDSASISAGLEDRVLQKLRAQQRGLRWLTGLAVAFWIVAAVASVGVMVFYSILYKPKEEQIRSDYERFGHIARHTNSATVSGSAGKLTAEEALGLHFTMNYVMAKGILAVAVSVIVLSCGTLTTLLLVVLNRRVTLGQINHSLARISEQLRQAQIKGDG